MANQVMNYALVTPASTDVNAGAKSSENKPGADAKEQ
jgi:hypothetical protein